MKKTILMILGAVAVLLAVAVIILTNGLSSGKSVVLSGIDLSGMPDGSYIGTYENGRWTNTLVVQVENHKIIGIDIDKDVFGAGATDCSGEVFRRVIEAQSTQVDAVSGATVTSKAYLMAIENALKK